MLLFYTSKVEILSQASSKEFVKIKKYEIFNRTKHIGLTVTIWSKLCNIYHK